MQPIHLAFVWHQHQPLYRDILRGRYVLPWVRLHAIKDYIGMLLLLKEFPNIRATINLAPSLIIQIEEYAEGTAEDDALRLTRKPADALDEAERRYVLEHFFACNPERLIRVFPRYNELFELRNQTPRSAARARKLFSSAALRDIQVWGTLAWFHPLLVESDEVLRELRNKGGGFTEEDKAAMLERQDEVIRRVLPLHRELADSGRIEISTTPFYHPILPLLCNMESAREAMPDVPMPERRADLRPDAEEHIRRAIQLHERVFGQSPTGMWPAEGSVSMDILPLLQGHGLRWIATDEQILARSMNLNFTRDRSAVLHSPDDLYQPYSLPGEGDLPAIVFRDHALADAIGFEYHHGDPWTGAENFLWRVHESARRCSGRPRLISVILDGENPWDYYGQAGLTFLRELYGRLSNEKEIATTRLTDYLLEHPPENQLPHLAAGSWIEGNFSIWIGAQEDRAAWSMLAEARDALTKRLGAQPPLDEKAGNDAWEHIYAAEGSDWFWWFGEEHTSEQDYMFDELFRAHLASVYHLIGEPAPESLMRPIGKPARPPMYTQPGGSLHVTFDGKPTDDFEWAAAGRCSAGSEGSAMHRAESVPVRELYYGFDADSFLLRLDASGNFREQVGADARIAVRFLKPKPLSIISDPLSDGHSELDLLDTDGNAVAEISAPAVAHILELGCPLTLLAAEPGNEIEFFVEVIRAGAPIQRVPHSGAVSLVVPAPDRQEAQQSARERT